MKYCVNARQPNSLLKIADEIKVPENDIDKILDFIEDFPDKTIILEVDNDLTLNEISMNTLNMYKSKLENFIINVKDIQLMNKFIELGFQAYWRFPIHTYYELRSLIECKPAYLIIGEPLCFDLDRIKKITDIPLRMMPNCAYEPYLLRENGIQGVWIRPEDIPVYEPYITALEFYSDNLKKESILFDTYKNKKSWPGNLKLLIDYMNYDIDNRAIPEDLAKKRLNCGQRCMSNGTCRACLTAFMFAETIQKIHDSKTSNTAN